MKCEIIKFSLIYFFFVHLLSFILLNKYIYYNKYIILYILLNNLDFNLIFIIYI